MNPSRETIEVVTPRGYKVKYYSYITGREFNELQNCYLAGAKAHMIGSEMRVDGFSPSAEADAKKKLVELLVVSVDEKTDSVVDIVLDMPLTDYNVVMEALNVVNGKKNA